MCPSFPNFKLMVKTETERTKSPTEISTETAKKCSVRILDTNPQIQSIPNSFQFMLPSTPYALLPSPNTSLWQLLFLTDSRMSLITLPST